MELTKQVCSLELAKELKELGVPQKSYFYWHHHLGMAIDENCNPKEPEDYGYHLLTNNGKVEVVDNKQSSSAFTVAELGEMLSKVNSEIFIKAYGDVFLFPGTQRVGLLGVVNLMKTPDMGAMMLIYLLEKKLITL